MASVRRRRESTRSVSGVSIAGADEAGEGGRGRDEDDDDDDDDVVRSIRTGIVGGSDTRPPPPPPPPVPASAPAAAAESRNAGE